MLVLMVAFLAIIQVQRMHRECRHPESTRRKREMVILMLVLLGLVVLWYDSRRNHFFAGTLKLLAIILVANLVIPCIWPVPPMPHHPSAAWREDDDGEHGEPMTRQRILIVAQNQQPPHGW